MRPISLPLFDSISYFFITDDAPGDQARDLYHGDFGAIGVDRETVPLVFRGSVFEMGHLEFAPLVAPCGDDSANRNAVDVHVENVEKHADPVAAVVEQANMDDSSISGRNGHGSGGDLALGVPEEVYAESAENETRQPPVGREYRATAKQRRL